MEKTANPPARPMGLALLPALAAGGALFAAPSVLLLLAILLAPGIFCLAYDRAPGRPVARSSLLVGSGFCVAPVWHLWLAGLSFGHAITQLSDLTLLAPAWCAGGLGWLLSELAPPVVRLVLNASTERHQRKLAATRRRLIEDWNLKAELQESVR